jgi:lycopene beta-cyclase
VSHFTYGVFELGWGVPVIAVQWIAGRKVLFAQWRTLTVSVALASIYLSVTDGIALSQHIWTLHGNRIVGVRIGDVPVEEIVFFVLTNCMVVQSILLVRAFLRRKQVLLTPYHVE